MKMSLDRQRILNELGSVMNQLQSADCGCMGKLFSNQSQSQGQNQDASMGSPLPTYGGCRRGCCHGHGYNYSTPCAGEPFSMNHGMNRPCMGQCNPPKLYADTYNYLSDNLMQPVMKEVYNDLKSINPGNTVMNSPIANQMGLSQGNPGAITEGNASNGMTGMQNISGMESTNVNAMAMDQSRQPMNAMGSMGPQIVNMIMGDGRNKPSNAQRMQGSQLTGPTVIDAPQSPHGQVGLTPIHPGQNTRHMNNTFNQQGNMGSAYGQNPTTQYMTQQPNMYSNPNGQRNSMMGNFSQNAGQGAPQTGNVNNTMVSGSSRMGSVSPASQQMTPANNQYGQHAPGVMKFNEMFPGVMQGGDLGFDPMAIAIQMNPANQQKAAMDTMHKLMNGGSMSRTMDPAVMKPVMNATKTAVQSINPPSTAPVGETQQNLPYGNQMANQQMPGGQQNNTILDPNTNQQMISGQQEALNQDSGAIKAQQNAVPQQQQQVYTAITGAPTLNQQQLQQQQMQAYQQQPNPLQQYQQPRAYQQPQTQYITDPNTGAMLTSPTMSGGYSEGTMDPNSQMQPPQSEQKAPQPITNSVQPMVKDPIFPADTSRNRPFTYSKPVKYSDYNTLGQPVEILPAKIFYPPEPSLPQTLSPQPTTKLRKDYMKYSNVKSTISKTSLMGNKPVGRTPSKSQLQHIYNQYKGSQSFTQQNVRPAVQGGTFSDGKLNVPTTNANPTQQIPVEKVGGDTAANTQEMPIKQQMGDNVIGDVLVSNKPQGDAPMKTSPVPARQAKLRNGLQDVVYTAYPSSAAWSFHGTNTYRPASPVYRFRNIR